MRFTASTFKSLLTSKSGTVMTIVLICLMLGLDLSALDRSGSSTLDLGSIDSPYSDLNVTAALSELENIELNGISCSVVSVTDVDCNGNETGGFTVIGSGGSGMYTYAILDTTPVSLPPCSELSPTYFNEFQFAWGFSLNNGSGTAITQWQVTICNADYTLNPNSITNNSDFVYTEVDNGDGTYDLVFTSTIGLGPFATTSNFAINGINFGFDPSSDGIKVNCTSMPVAGSTVNTNGVFTDLAPGSYTVVVTDPNNPSCTSECTVEITEPEVLSCSTASTGVMDCGLNDGSITVTPVGGTAGYSYNAGSGTVSANVISNLAPGSYIVTVTDANGCTSTCASDIMGLITPSCTIGNVVNVDCPGNATGSFIVTGMGGNTTAYSFTDGTTTNTNGVFTMLTAGNYMVTISEQANPNCTSVCSVVLTEPQLTCSMSILSNVSCNGLSDGVATVMGSGGTPLIGPELYTYAWDNGETTATAIMLSAGPHSVTVTDAQGCTTTCAVVITENPALSCSILIDHLVSCAGGNDGVLIATANGGTGTFQYSLDGIAFQSSDTFVGLSAGTYTITAMDSNGCTTTCSIILTEIPTLICSAVATTVMDCGVDDGTITVTALGGTPAYTFDAGAGTVSGNVISGLAPGNYLVTVTDARGCTSVCPTEVMSLNMPTCSIGSVVNVLCNGAMTGSFITTGMGGNTTAYNFTDGVTTNTDGVFTLLAAGLYTVTVSEQANPMCTNVCAIEITEPAELTCATTLVSDVSCNSLSDGSASVIGAGGIAPYTYAWDNGESGATAVLLNASTHIVTVTDANGCINTCNVIIGENPILSCAITVISQVNCHGESNGAFTTNAVGGDGSYEYSLNGAPFQTAGSFANLIAGTYTVTTRDGNGCTTSCSVIITEPTELTCSTVTTPVMDCGLDDGAITVTATGGSGSFTYDAGMGIVTGNVITNLGPGSYTVVVTVTDMSGCSTSCQAVVMGLNTPSCTISNVVNLDCNGNASGSYLVTGSGGNSTDYVFTDGATTNTDGVFTMLAAGNYIVTISEQTNPMCASVCNVEVTEPEALTCVATASAEVSCNGLADGGAIVSVLGGTPFVTGSQYTYAWDNGETNSIASQLNAGLHVVTVTDANGCTTTVSYTHLTLPTKA